MPDMPTPAADEKPQPVTGKVTEKTLKFSGTKFSDGHCKITQDPAGVASEVEFQFTIPSTGLDAGVAYEVRLQYSSSTKARETPLISRGLVVDA